MRDVLVRSPIHTERMQCLHYRQTGPGRPFLFGRRLMLLAAVAILSLVGGDLAADGGEVGLPRFPSISPIGSELAFSWGGDLWRVPAEGGQALRLTRHSLDDLHSSWSPDGRRIAFASMRDGYLNIWRINRDGTAPTQLTFSDRFMRNPSYGTDDGGETVITFSGLLEADVYRDQRPYVVSPDGGEHRRLHDAFGSEPRLSPDGSRVAFTRGGYYHDWNRRRYTGPDAMNVWIYDRTSEEFTQVTNSDGDDGQAHWADDQTLIFMSDRRNDTVNLYRVELGNSAWEDPEELQFDTLTGFREHDLRHFDVSRDGSTAVLQVWDTLYTLDLEDPEAEPQPVRIQAAEDGHDDTALRRIDNRVTEAELSPDGRVMAYIAYGRVYIRHMDDHSPTRAVTPGTHARHSDLRWSPDGLRLYFTNDADGTSSIYEARVALTREEIRRAFEQPPPAPTREDREIPRLVPPQDPADEPEAPPTDNDEPDPQREQDEIDDPFGPVDPGHPTDPVTPPDPHDPTHQPPPPQEQPAQPDTVPEDELDPEDPDTRPAQFDPARWHDAVQFTVRPVVQTTHNDREPSPSPDGRYLAFRRGRGDLVIRNLETRHERVLVEGWDSTIQWRWSPDSQFIAYAQNDLNFSANIFIVPADGSADPVNVTRHPRNDHNPRWSADGRILTFISNRSGDTYDLYRVYLDRELETYTPRELSTYYRDAAAAAGRRTPLPVRVPGAAPDSEAPAAEYDPAAEPESSFTRHDLETAWRRVERVTATPYHEFGNEMTPGGNRYVFNVSGQGLTVMDWDGGERRLIGASAAVQHLSISGDRVVYVAGGRVGVAPLAGGQHVRPDISDRIRVDLRQESLQKFHEAARMIGESFYQPDMKGLDWPALVEEYEQLVGRARTASEFSDVINSLMGELAASHMGVSNPGPASALREPSGRLGIEHERVALEDDREGYRVLEVVPEGPAARGPMRLQVGDIITEINLEPFRRRDTLLRSLRGSVDQEIIVTFERPVADGRLEYRALLTPIGYGELAELKYNAFRERSRELVRELSDGRLGYIHIEAMNQTSLEEFQGDLYAAAYGKEGLIIDVRNNGGGHTTDRILTSIMAKEHAYTIPAGADPAQRGHYPQDRLDAPRYTLPINMLANEKSYSNAEILAHAFRTLDRGTLVGEQTYGGVISTGVHTLIDGATVRRPFRGWYLPDGTDMEHYGAEPDIRVRQTPEDEVAQRDRQLEYAVEDMLNRNCPAPCW